MKVRKTLFKCLLFCSILFSGIFSSANAEIISQSGTAQSGTWITSGDISIYWSAANLNYGYFYTANGTLFGDIKPSAYWSYEYATHDGVRNVWDFKNASDYTFSEPSGEHDVIFVRKTQNDSETYRGLVLFSQDGKYGVIEPIEIYEEDGQRYLSYNIWHDTTGASDFTSLNPKPSTVCFYGTASATQNETGTTTYYGDPGEWLMIRKPATSQGGDGFLKFELNGIDANAVITSAKLTIWHNSIHDGPLDLGIYRGSNDDWSLTDLDSPIGYNPDQLMGSATITSGGHLDLDFPLTTGSADLLRNDTQDQAITLGLIPEDSSNESVYSYFEGVNTFRVRQPYLSVTFSNLPGDYDRDADVDGTDIADFALYYGNSQAEADLDKNTILDSLDIELFAQNFGKSNIES